MSQNRPIRSVEELPLEGRRVFVRVDFNVPLEGTKVTDDTRIRAALPTMEHILARGGRLVLASHLGRPDGQVKPELSLEPVAARLAELLSGGEVLLTDDCTGDGARKVVGDLRDGQVALLENLRFHPEEEANDENFARELARLADVYVNDAFGAAHRAHASVSALAALIPERGAGLLLLKELGALEELVTNPPRPYLAVLGGAKVSDKVAVLDALVAKANALLIGGVMANTFLAAQGVPMGKSRVEEERLAMARSVLQRGRDLGVEVILPEDVIVAESPSADSGRATAVLSIAPTEMALDIGPRTIASYRERIATAGAVFWNGPMGFFERPAFSEGTFGVAKAIAACPGLTVVGGGDSVAAVHQADLADRFSHVSTGGGASLEFIEGRKLPGVEALR